MKRANQTQEKELIAIHQASSLVIAGSKMGLNNQSSASTSSQQDILVQDHQITKITINESNSPQLLMQPGVTLSCKKFEELNMEGEIVVEFRAELEFEANEPKEATEEVCKEVELTKGNLQQIPRKKKKGKKRDSKSKVAEHLFLGKI
ncbi:unnamed protein product [Ilex paraguariensis]|uniref:Uncharacterized protein n=1 Tax=Ilex paraguariensis TaxID=185542 RepID=A0ABC8UEY1_9AQUA